jgi:hypothetical protein
MNQHTALSISEIKNEVNNLKKKASADVITNYYWQHKSEQEKYECVIGNYSIFFTEKDADFFRLFFYSVNEEEFNSMLAEINLKPLVIDYLANYPIDNIEKSFINAGFRPYAKMLRFRNGNIPQITPSANEQATLNNNKILHRLEKFFRTTPVKDIIHFAVASDCDQVLKLLYANLDKYTGHFPSADELLDLIGRQQVLVIKDGGIITGVVLFKINGKTCNLDQGYSDPCNEEVINVKLFFEFYKTLNQKEVKSMYLWVEEKNKSVINLHKSFGLKPDGLIDYVYIKN